MADETVSTPTAAPKDTVDAQIQGHIEHAEEEAELAQKKAAALEAELEEAKAKSDAREAPKPPEPGELSEFQKQMNFERSQVVVTQLAEPAVPRVVTEEVRLAAHKEMVKDHLRNANPDMTPNTGPEDLANLDPQTGLPEGHPPEGGNTPGTLPGTPA